ncbi:MAG TPA: hypothetical protein VGY54_25585 [Polyangiaceae bacterium]|nr:hypothetical protein [Polyangiaceae bacterium]
MIGVHWGAPELAVPDAEPEGAPDAPDAAVPDDEPDPAAPDAEPEATPAPDEPETAVPDDGNAPDADVDPAEPEVSPELNPEVPIDPDVSIVPEEGTAPDAAPEIAPTPDEPVGTTAGLLLSWSPVAQPAASRLMIIATTNAHAAFAAGRRT